MGRTGYGTLTRHTTVTTRTTVILLAAATTTALGLLPGPAALLTAAAILAGTARGVFTLLQATAITDRWGTCHYATLAGILAAPLTAASALAPWAGTALAGPLGGYPHVFLVLTGLTLAATVLAALSRPSPPHDEEPAAD
jgi:MFS family permease